MTTFAVNLSEKLQIALDKKRKNKGFDTLPQNVLGLKDIPEWIKRYIPVKFKPYDYQYEVVKWMTERKHGGVLHLEQGLGKTYTSLLHMNLTYSMCNLVVCNKSQIIVWREEIAKFYGKKVKVLYAHKEVDGALNSFDREKLEYYDVVVTSYESITSCYKYESDFSLVYWNNVYCDEVHKIRNAQTELYEMIGRIKRKNFWGLTASLIHNKIEDARNIQALVHEDSIYSLANIKTLRFVDVGIELPKLHMKYVYTGFTCVQQGYYEAYAKKAKEILEDLSIVDKLKPKNKKSWASIFAILTRLRQITISPKLLEASHDITFDDDDGYRSPRIEAVSKQVYEAEGQCVVFCFFRKSLELIARNLREKGVRCKIIKAEHKTDKKNWYINQFRKEDYKALLFTYKTGGLGFNLACSNNVMLCSLWWNMEVIQQAFRRCYRLGQTKETNVYFFMKKGSIEDRMLELCKKKRDMTDNFLLENYRPMKISKEVLRLLF